jgi:hypothetical protein
MDKLGYTFYPKDFISDPDVMMMTPAERGIYRDLIDLAYMSDNSIKYSLIQLSKYCNAEIEQIENILKLKGLKVGENWTIPSCNKRIAKAKINKENGTKGGRPPKPKNNPNQNPIDNPNETQTERQRERERESKKEIEIESKFNFKSNLVSLGLDEQIANDYLKVRKAKKGVNSKTAFDMLISEVKKSNKPISECIKLCIERNWITYKAEWDKNSTQNNKQLFRCKMSNPANGHFVVDLTEEEIEKRTATGYTKLMTKTPL